MGESRLGLNVYFIEKGMVCNLISLSTRHNAYQRGKVTKNLRNIIENARVLYRWRVFRVLLMVSDSL